MITANDFINGYKQLSKIPRLGHSPLAGLALVRQRLYEDYYVESLVSRHLAVVDVLTQFLSSQLATIRQRCGIAVIEGADKTREGACEVMRRDRNSHNIHLKSCSFLYYRYVRTDLGFSVAELSRQVGYSDVHTRRLTKEYWPYLHQMFIRQEYQLRGQLRLTQAQLAIPEFIGIRVPGQSALIDQLVQQIRTGQSAAVLMKGTAGIGKTSLLTAVGQALIDRDIVHYAVLLDGRTDDLRDVGAALVSKLSMPSNAGVLSLPEILVHLEQTGERLLVVIDNVDGWEAVMTQYWGVLSHCQLLVTAVQGWAQWPGVIVDCPALSQADARILLEYWYQALPLSDKDVAYFWQRSGGNPAQLKRLLLEWLDEDKDQ